jgi:hypothetical protein
VTIINILSRKKAKQEREARIQALRKEYYDKKVQTHREISELSGKVINHPEFGNIAIIVPSLYWHGPERRKLYCSQCDKKRTCTHLSWEWYYCEKCLNVIDSNGDYDKFEE